ncbi:MAG: TrmO family methyltransferase, partial [Eubacterium sp.]|nr:TrmO family methyltransferase [Eubacterium sp.]
MTEFDFCAVAHIQNDYKEKFGIPRQSGLVDEVVSRIIFMPEYRNHDAVRGLEAFSHLWLVWVFSDGFSH